MKKHVLIIICIIIFILICIIMGVVFASNSINDNNNETLISKTEDEIEYLENTIIEMTNKLNNINFLNAVIIETKEENKEQNKQSSNESANEENNNTTNSENIKYEVKSNSILLNDNLQIDWEYIKTNIENIYSIWPTIIVDLNSLNVNKEDILNFSNTLDQVTLTIKQEDKIASLNNLASMYGFLPKYLSQFSKDTKKINIGYTKNCLLNSYALLEQNKWDEIKVQNDNAINYYSNVMNDINISQEKQNRISKIYILLNEINNTTTLQDKELFYIKYRNTMQELMNL